MFKFGNSHVSRSEKSKTGLRPVSILLLFLVMVIKKYRFLSLLLIHPKFILPLFLSLCLYFCIYLSLYFSFSLSLSLFLSLSFSLFLSFPLSLFLYFSLTLFLSFSLSLDKQTEKLIAIMIRVGLGCKLQKILIQIDLKLIYFIHKNARHQERLQQDKYLEF